MSRALNVTSQAGEVEALCKRHSIDISTIETLASGGTRVVLLNPTGAARVRELLKAKLITTPVVRSSLYIARRPQSNQR